MSLGKVVGDIMSRKLFLLRKDQTLDLALRLLVTNNISRLPIMDENNKLVGIISDRDIRFACDSPFLPETNEERIAKLAKHKVSEIMKTALITVEETAPIVEAAKLMRVSNVGGLPVLNQDGQLVGICTRSDLIDHLIRLLEPLA